MHAMDCKGLTAIVAGGVLYKLVWHEASLGATKAERLANVNIRLDDFYKANPCGSRLYDLREENITGQTLGIWLRFFALSACNSLAGQVQRIRPSSVCATRWMTRTT